MIRLSALLLLLLSLPLHALELPAFYSVSGVAADDVLNIRAAPEAAAPVLGTLAPNATGVEVISIVDGWAVVNAQDVTGYAKLSFLEREAGPDWNTLAMPLTCLGTEPFWSLAIDPEAGKAGFLSPEDQEPRVSAITRTWPGAPWARAAALELPEGLAVLSPAECSDGMSDRSYGIAVDLFLTTADPDIGRDRLSGCCLLAAP